MLNDRDIPNASDALDAGATPNDAISSRNSRRRLRQQIAFPAYFEVSQPAHPVWQTLVAEGRDAIGIAIFDDWDVLASAKPVLQASGIRLFGRVSTHKGTVAPEVCTAILDDWFTRHADLAGIYVDEGPPLDTRHPEYLEPDWVWDYYGEKNGLYGYVKGKYPGAQVLLNCAGCRDERIFTACDIAQVVEQDYVRYMTKSWWSGASQPWWTNPPIGKAIAHIVHSCPGSHDDRDWAMRVAVGLSKCRGAHYVYVFNGDPAAGVSLPAYWDAELAAVIDSPAEPCDVVAGVVLDIEHALDDLDAETSGAIGDTSARLMQEISRLEAMHVEVEAILEECREG